VTYLNEVVRSIDDTGAKKRFELSIQRITREIQRVPLGPDPYPLVPTCPGDQCRSLAGWNSAGPGWTVWNRTVGTELGQEESCKP
jgi:hypothetical protein